MFVSILEEPVEENRKNFLVRGVRPIENYIQFFGKLIMIGDFTILRVKDFYFFINRPTILNITITFS